MSDKISLIMITGMPGVGKTTITKRLFHSLTQKAIGCSGFYTEEIRDNQSGDRTGFDIITLHDSKRNKLARYETNSEGIRRPKIGKYSVYVDEFEEAALKTVTDFYTKPKDQKQILIIDEIGRMELMSEKFEKEVKKLMEKVKKNDITMFATVPLAQRAKLKIVDDLLKISNGKLFHIKKTNRNDIYNDIEKAVLDACTQKSNLK